MLLNRAIELIEDTFSDYMIGKIDEGAFFNKLSTALDNLPFNSPKTFNITIEKSTGMKRTFFGIDVFPSINSIKEVCNSIANAEMKYEDVVKQWREISDWEIVIDSLVFDRSYIAFNPKELTAMLLHEIGHVTQSDEPIEQFYQAYKETTSNMKSADKISKKALYILYTIPLAIACTSRRWVNDENELRLEISSDRSLIETGYADHLITALDKIIKAEGSVTKTNDQNYQEIVSNVEWANRNVVDIVQRRDNLKDSLYYKAIQTNLGYIQALCSHILDFLGVRMKERYTGAVAESCMLNELVNGEITLETHVPIFDIKKFGKIENFIVGQQKALTAATEGLFFNRRKKEKVSLPDEYDLDRIFIAIDDIQNNSDKLYVLDLIYENIEKLNNFEEAIASDEAAMKKWESRIKDMRGRLEALRKAAISKQLSKKEYKVFVKYPEGYEG